MATPLATGLGLGLSGAKRLCNEFAIQSAPGKGTVVMLGAMEMSVITAVTEPSQVAQARRVGDRPLPARPARRSRGSARSPSWSTELATNLLKHGGGGEILAERFDDSDGAGIEVLALDRGSGMADVARCMQDGYSTAGSLGQGLGAASRQTGPSADLVPARTSAPQSVPRFVLEKPVPGSN